MANIIKSKLDADQVIRRAYDDDKNRLRVDAEVEAVISSVDVVIDAAGGDNIAIANADGTDFAEVTNGALHVLVSDDGKTTKNIFGEITGIVSGVTSIIASYTAVANTKLLRIDVGGTNVAAYSIYIDNILIAKKYTYYTTLNESFEFTNGLPVVTGNIISVEVLHERPHDGDFNTNILVEN